MVRSGKNEKTSFQSFVSYFIPDSAVGLITHLRLSSFTADATVYRQYDLDFSDRLYPLLSYLCLVCLPLFRQERTIQLLFRSDRIIGKHRFPAFFVLSLVASENIQTVFFDVFQSYYIKLLRGVYGFFYLCGFIDRTKKTKQLKIATAHRQS